MRILLVNYEYPPVGAGAATATAAIAHAAARQGHEVTVMTTAFGDLAGHAREGEVDVLRVRARRARPDQSSISEMASFVIRAAFAMPGVVRRFRPEGCIVFFSVPCGPLGIVFKLLARAPYVVSLRGGDVPGTEPGLARMHRLLRPARRLVLAKAAAVVANSPGLAELSGRADPVPVSVIPNGVDLERFHPAAQPPAEPFRFLFVGRLNEQKNVGLLLDAAADLLRDSRRPFRLGIVGDGPLRETLAAKASALGLDGVVEWTRWLPRDRMPATYQAAHCVVNPSHYEGMPNVVLEAMACGLPVIVSDVAGNRDVVEDGRDGHIVAHDSRQALAEAMARALRDPEGLRELGARARESVARKYSWEAATSRYVELLASGRAPAA